MKTSRRRLLIGACATAFGLAAGVSGCDRKPKPVAEDPLDAEVPVARQ